MPIVAEARNPDRQTRAAVDSVEFIGVPIRFVAALAGAREPIVIEADGIVPSRDRVAPDVGIVLNTGTCKPEIGEGDGEESKKAHGGWLEGVRVKVCLYVYKGVMVN
jgi:hypothetical protein